MAEVTLNIGGRSFVVGCQDGEEPQLQQAASLLDAEASVLQNQLGRVPEVRMLLMAGLMLADRTVEIAEQAHAAGERADSLDRKLRQVEAKAAEMTSRALHAAGGASEEDLAEARATADAALAALEEATARIEALAQKSQ